MVRPIKGDDFNWFLNIFQFYSNFLGTLPAIRFKSSPLRACGLSASIRGARWYAPSFFLPKRKLLPIAPLAPLHPFLNSIKLLKYERPQASPQNAPFHKATAHFNGSLWLPLLPPLALRSHFGGVQASTCKLVATKRTATAHPHKGNSLHGGRSFLPSTMQALALMPMGCPRLTATNCKP